MVMSMREKIARALYASDRVVEMLAIEKIWGDLLANPARSAFKKSDRKYLDEMRAETWETNGRNDDYYRRADAALEALLEPTEGMINAALAQTKSMDLGRRTDECAIALIAFEDMIRAAKEGK